MQISEEQATSDEQEIQKLVDKIKGDSKAIAPVEQQRAVPAVCLPPQVPMENPSVVRNQLVSVLTETQMKLRVKDIRRLFSVVASQEYGTRIYPKEVDFSHDGSDDFETRISGDGPSSVRFSQKQFDKLVKDYLRKNVFPEPTKFNMNMEAISSDDYWGYEPYLTIFGHMSNKQIDSFEKLYKGPLRRMVSAIYRRVHQSHMTR